MRGKLLLTLFFLLTLLIPSAMAQTQDPFWTWVAAIKAGGAEGQATLATVIERYQAGDPAAGAVLGYLYLDGVVYPRDLNRAWEFFSWAHRQESSWGAVWMASMLGLGLYQVANQEEAYKQAVDLLRWAMAQGNLTAQALYAGFLMFGLGVQADPAKALQLIQEAAEKGDPLGKHQLARAYSPFEGFPRLLEPDLVKARGLYEEAVKGGVYTAPGRLAFMLYHGLGGPADPKRAAELAKPYVGLEGFATGVYLLALYEGKGIAQNKAEACKLAAGPEGEVVPGYSAYILAHCLKEKGQKVEAYAYLLKAAAWNVPEANPLLKEWEKELTREELEAAKARFKSLP